MMKRNTSLIWILGACLLLAGCSFKKAEEKGKEIFPEVQKFDRLMDKTNHAIGWHGGVGAPLTWFGRGIVYGRYEIFMNFEVSVSIFNEPKRISESSYIINEFWNKNDASGGMELRKTTRGVLSQAQWDQVQKVDDIFKILGLVPITNQPIAWLEESWQKRVSR